VDHAEQALTAAPADEKVQDGTETVLLAEDDAAVRTLTRRMLTRRGYRVLEASDGAEALAVADRHAGSIDLLLTDMVMPAMGGRDLAARFRAVRTDVPVLIMSGYTEDAIGSDHGIPRNTSILQKPFTPAALAKKVREALDRVRPMPEEAPVRS
jgi:CheY-like chemotaxis protein